MMMPRGDAGAAADVVDLHGGRVISRWLDDETVEVTYSGHAGEALVAEGARQFWRVAGDRSVRFALVEAGAVTGIEGGIARVGRLWLSQFKAQGGQLITVIATLSALRMVLAAILFASGAPARTVSSREEAVAQIARARARATGRFAQKPRPL